MSQYITKEGFEKLKEELEYLKTVQQKEITERLRKAISYGDLSENFDYADAREQQTMLLAKIAELEEQIREAKIVAKEAKSDKIQIGSTVEVESSGSKFTFTVVTAQEANPSEGKISVESPIGGALFGKKEGEKAGVQTPCGAMQYIIRRIIP